MAARKKKKGERDRSAKVANLRGGKPVDCPHTKKKNKRKKGKGFDPFLGKLGIVDTLVPKKNRGTSWKKEKEKAAEREKKIEFSRKKNGRRNILSIIPKERLRKGTNGSVTKGVARPCEGILKTRDPKPAHWERDVPGEGRDGKNSRWKAPARSGCFRARHP